MRKPLRDEIQYGCFHSVESFLKAYRTGGRSARFRDFLNDQPAEYDDDLFKGTNAAVSIPLWASACLTGEPILLNQITLDIIAFL